MTFKDEDRIDRAIKRLSKFTDDPGYITTTFMNDINTLVSISKSTQELRKLVRSQASDIVKLRLDLEELRSDTHG